MMNLLLGMCKGAAGLPRHLRLLGYSDRWIEYAFKNSKNETVVPELILASRDLKHTLLWEWKSGANTDAEQLQRYSAITADDLRGKVSLTQKESQSHDVVLVGTEEHCERIVVAIDSDKHSFPVLLTTDTGLRKVRNRFRPDSLENVFQPELEVDWNGVPTFLFPLDRDSELWEFGELMIRDILKEMASGSTRILLAQLAMAIIPCWGIVDRAYQGQLEAKMCQVMFHACRREFKPYFQRNKSAASRTHTQTWDITRNPLVESPDRRHKEWKTMRKLQEAFLHFLRSGDVTPEQEEFDF